MAALLLGEAEGTAVAERLRGADLLAPALLPFAIASACIKKMRREPDRRDALMVAFGMALKMGYELVTLDRRVAAAGGATGRLA